LEDLDIDGKIIINQILKKIGCEGVEWIHLAQDRDQWQALVSTIMNLWPK
jgi:phosphoribosyl-ATP pyrophosphohydrolase